MKTIFTSCSIALCLFTANAQQERASIISDFSNSKNAEVSINETTKTPDFIQFSADKALKLQGATAADKVYGFLADNANMYGITSVSEELKLKETIIDDYGLTHTTLEQFYKGVPVFDGKLRFHFNDNKEVSSINGNVIPTAKLNPIPKLSQAEASNVAVNIVKEKGGQGLKAKQSKLYVFQKGLAQGLPGRIHLVYEVEVGNGLDVREFVYVDAHNGKIVEQFTGIGHALNRFVFQGLDNPQLIWKEGDPYPANLNQWQKNEVTTSGHVYNFFKNAFGRDSYDNAGGNMITVNISDTLAICPNAFWNGELTLYCEGSAADDVIAHEWGHAYTQYTSELIYAFQSGSLNESFSDIWGETIDLINDYEDEGEDLSKRNGCESSDRWQLGEDAIAFGEPLRDLWRPSCKQIGSSTINYPDDISEYLCLDRGFDSGGVHLNSSIPNHAYALLVDGGFFNGVYVNGIGLTKAAHIFWRVQSEYLTKTSDFNDFARALESAAVDLRGKKLSGLSVTSEPKTYNKRISIMDYLQVQKVIYAIGLREDIDFCEFEPILSPIDPLCDNSKTPIYKEDWESGIGNWTLEQLPVNPTTWESRDWTLESNLPEGRKGKSIFAINPIVGDCQEDLDNGIIRLQSPEITVNNSGSGDFEMAFNHYVATESSWDRTENRNLYWDGGNIKYSLNNGDWTLIPANAFTANGYNSVLEAGDNPMQLEPAFAGSNEGENKGSWGTSVINLSSLGLVSGDSIAFRFELGTDGCNGNLGWYIDEIMIYNCEEAVLSKANYKLNAAVNVYPNPSKNGIYTLQSNEKVNLINAKVYDINGRLITSVDVSRNRIINLSETSTGVYFMTVTSNTETGTFKLVKN